MTNDLLLLWKNDKKVQLGTWGECTKHPSPKDITLMTNTVLTAGEKRKLICQDLRVIIKAVSATDRITKGLIKGTLRLYYLPTTNFTLGVKGTFTKERLKKASKFIQGEAHGI